MDLLHTLLAAIVTLGLLVSIHEYGHFWVARRCGVRVLRFSIGFGRALLRWHDRQGTEYVLAAIPLGGYVKMLDEREAPVPPELLDQAFNRKPLAQRVAVVLAGPAVNLLFAVLAYWMLFMAGISTLAPVVGGVAADTPAARSTLATDEEILAVDGHETATWEEVNLRLASRIGDSGILVIRTRPLQESEVRTHRVPLDGWRLDETLGPLGSLGIEPWRPRIKPVIGQVLEEGAAAAAGLKPGDRVLAVDGEPLNTWQELVSRVRERPLEAMQLQVERDTQTLVLDIRPQRRESAEGDGYGYIGVGVQPVSWPESMQRTLTYGPVEAIVAAFEKTAQMVSLILESIAKMIQGLMSVKNLSGPITIAKVAGDSAASGLETFLNFLAYLSISLGVLNLLPIPMLDGGHLLYYLIEAVRGKPVSEQTQALGLRLGLALLLSLMILALYNDLMRL